MSPRPSMIAWKIIASKKRKYNGIYCILSEISSRHPLTIVNSENKSDIPKGLIGQKLENLRSPSRFINLRRFIPFSDEFKRVNCKSTYVLSFHVHLHNNYVVSNIYLRTDLRSSLSKVGRCDKIS